MKLAITSVLLTSMFALGACTGPMWPAGRAGQHRQYGLYRRHW